MTRPCVALLLAILVLHADDVLAKRKCQTFTVPADETPTCGELATRFMSSDLWTSELRWENSPAASDDDGGCTSQGCDCPIDQVLEEGARIFMCGVCFPYTASSSAETCASIQAQECDDYALFPETCSVTMSDGVTECEDANISDGTALVVCDISSDQTVLGYVGSYPWGYPAPALNDIPYACNVLALSFANAEGGDGIYTSAWDPSLSKAAIDANKLVIPDRKFIMTLGGWLSPWPDSCGTTSNKARFITNSVETIVGILDDNGLDGIDINYERGPGVATWDNAYRKGDWQYCMREMIEGLKAVKPNLWISMSPFGTTTSTYPHYKELLMMPLDSNPSANVLSLVDQVNWQIYGTNPQSSSAYTSSTAGYGRMINDGIPASKLSMGIEVDQRGLDYGPSFDAFDAVRDVLGIRNTFLWSTEQSSPSQPAFCHETNFAYRMGIAPEPFVLCGFPSRKIPTFEVEDQQVIVTEGTGRNDLTGWASNIDVDSARCDTVRLSNEDGTPWEGTYDYAVGDFKWTRDNYREGRPLYQSDSGYYLFAYNGGQRWIISNRLCCSGSLYFYVYSAAFRPDRIDSSVSWVVNGQLAEGLTASCIAESDTFGYQFLTQILDGPADLFDTVPRVENDGTLVVTPAANTNGIATLRVILEDDNNTPNGGSDDVASFPYYVIIYVAYFNNVPSFTLNGDTAITVVEDSGTNFLTNWASDMSAGPADESEQLLRFNVEPLLAEGYPLRTCSIHTVSEGDSCANLALLYFNDFDAYENIQRIGTPEEGGVRTPCLNETNPLALGQPLQICGTCQSHAFANGDSCGAIASQYGVSLTDVRVIPPNFVYDPDAPIATVCADPLEVGSLIVVCDLPMFTVPPAVDVVTGTLTFAPAPQANGYATFAITLVDDNGTPDEAIDDGISEVVEIRIDITAVNDDPIFTHLGNQAFLAGEVEVTVRPWATYVSPGSPDEIENEIDMAFAVNVLDEGANLFSVLPAVDVGGSLVFTPATFGSAFLEVTLNSGGASFQQEIRIQIIPTDGQDAGAGVGIATKTVAANSGPGFVVNWMADVLENALLSHDQSNLYFKTTVIRGGREECFLHDVRYDVYPDGCGNLAIKFLGSSLPSNVAKISHSEDGRACGAADPYNQFGNATGLDLGQKLTICGSCVEYAVDASRASALTCANMAALYGVEEDSVQVFRKTETDNLVRDSCTTELLADYVGVVQAENVYINNMNQATNGTAPLIPLQFGVCNLPLFDGTPSVDTTSGSLAFTPLPNAFGNITLRADLFTSVDDTAVASPEFIFLEVTEENQQPFVNGWTNKVSVLEDNGPVYESIALEVSPGWTNELDQAADFTLAVVNGSPASLFDILPTIDRLGNLRFVAKDDAFGVVTYTVNYEDPVGLNVDLELEIEVVSVNDPPSFRVTGDTLQPNDTTMFSLKESEGVINYPGFVMEVSPGPANEADQRVRFEAVRVDTASARNTCFRLTMESGYACATLATAFTGSWQQGDAFQNKIHHGDDYTPCSDPEVGEEMLVCGSCLLHDEDLNVKASSLNTCASLAALYEVDVRDVRIKDGLGYSLCEDPVVFQDSLDFVSYRICNLPLFGDNVQVSVNTETATGELTFSVGDTLHTDLSGPARYILYAVDDNGTPDDDSDDERFTGIWNSSSGNFDTYDEYGFLEPLILTLTIAGVNDPPTWSINTDVFASVAPPAATAERRRLQGLPETQYFSLVMDARQYGDVYTFTDVFQNVAAGPNNELFQALFFNLTIGDDNENPIIGSNVDANLRLFNITPAVINDKDLQFSTNFFPDTQSAETFLTIQLSDDNGTPDDPTDDMSTGLVILNIRFTAFKKGVDSVAVASIGLTFGVMLLGLFMTRVVKNWSCAAAWRTLTKGDAEVFALKDPDQVNRMTMTRIDVTAPESFSRAGYSLQAVGVQSASSHVRTRLDNVDESVTFYDKPRGSVFPSIVVSITMYNEPAEAMALTLKGVYDAINNMAELYGDNVWDAVVVIIVSDGRSKIDAGTAEFAKGIGMMDLDRVNSSNASHSNETPNAYLFENRIDDFILAVDDGGSDLHGSGQGSFDGGGLPSSSSFDSKSSDGAANSGKMQVAFLLKEENAGKLHSHRWVFNSFCTQVQPEYIYLVDVGTIPHVDSFSKMFECMEKEPNCGGCCGEIIPYNPDWYNLVVVAQIFEYKVSNVMDKAMESIFGYIPVLPGAFSAYRYAAIEPENYGGIIRGPLVEYFAHFRMPAESVSALKGNMFLAEDRILCFEIISRAKSNWFLRYADGCYGETDVPYRLVDLMVQRRRWLNGAIFAMIYAMKHMGRFFQKSRHENGVKARILFQCLFYIVNLTAFWFALSTAILVLYYVFRSTLSESSTFPWLHDVIIGVFFALVLLQIVMTFATTDPRSSKKSRLVYRVISGIHGVVALLFVTQTFILVFFGADDLGLRIIGSIVFGSVAIVAIVAGNGTAGKLSVSMLPYLFMLPTFMIMFPIYSICNLNDLSWGTKGLSKHKYKTLPGFKQFKQTIANRLHASGSISSTGAHSQNGSEPAMESVDLESTAKMDNDMGMGHNPVEEGWGSTDNPILEEQISKKKRTQTLDLFPDFRDVSRAENDQGMEMTNIGSRGRKISVGTRHEGKGSGGIDCGFEWDASPKVGRTMSQYAAYNKRERKKDKWDKVDKASVDVDARYRNFRNGAFLAWIGSNLAFTLSILLSADNGTWYLTTVFIFTASVNTPRLLGALAFYFESRLWVGSGRPDEFKNSFPFLCIGGLWLQAVAFGCSMASLFSHWYSVECTYANPTDSPVMTYWFLPQVCLDSELGGGNCYEYSTVESFSASILRYIDVVFGEVEGLPADYGEFLQASESRLTPALALTALAAIFHVFSFFMYAMMYNGKLRMWETSSFLMWIFGIISILTFTTLLLVTGSPLYDPTPRQLPFCLDPSQPSNFAEATSWESGPGLVSAVWLLVSSGFQVVILTFVNIYGTVKSAAAVKKIGKKLKKQMNTLHDKVASPRAAATTPKEGGVPRCDSVATSTTKNTLTWLRKAAAFEFVFFVCTCVTTATSWFQLRCYSKEFDGVLPQTYFDQWVQYFSLLEVCYFKSDGDCYGYDEKYPDEQKSTFNPMAGMVFLAVITHLILLVTFSFLGAAQVFSKHIKGTAVDRALCLENNSIPIGTLCLSLFAALLHFITIMILTTSDLYNASTGSSILSLQTYCSADFAASGVDNGGDLDDGFDVDGGGLVRYLADANVPDFGPADALSTELTRGVGPAMVLTVLLFLCAMGEALYIRLRFALVCCECAKNGVV
jgi:cellulose synthase/poly-beta-1,6-N-acetylglucosamine synthase-like glycosyltransferase